jgi:putative DNA methylase
LHLWWARRPLAACRSMLLGLLLPDPCDVNCPKEFKDRAHNILSRIRGTPGTGDKALRDAILRFIGEFADWDNSSRPTYVEVAQALLRAANGDEPPLLIDPFSGGGSIPLEGLRLGCDVFASDLNPVACLILKTILDDVPRNGPALASDLRRHSKDIIETAQARLSAFYPSDRDGTKPIAYLWARTVICDSCGAEVPLIRSFWLSKKSGRNRALKLQVTKNEGMKFAIFEPKSESEVSQPTITNGKATCPACHLTILPKRVKSQLTQQNGGSDAIIKSGHRESGATLLAVVRRGGVGGGISYRLPDTHDWEALESVASRLKEELQEHAMSLPNEPINPIRPSPNARGVSGATRIGITDFGRLFTRRQHLALSVLSQLVRDSKYSAVQKKLLMLAVSKLTERNSSFVTWINSTEAPRGTFSRQALTIAWDFVELVPVNADEELNDLIEAMARVIEVCASSMKKSGAVQQASATDSPLPDNVGSVWFTDPPYYDSVPYADLSDFFYVWLKRILPEEIAAIIKEEDETGLTPKAAECTWDAAHTVDGHPKTPQFFEQSIALAFREGRRTLASTGIGCIVFAHKSTEGWEALLAGILNAGWVVIASWPIRTERGARLNARDSAALATSVHLVCRPRPEDAPVGEWADVLRELPLRVGDWIERLQGEGIKGADLVFACIGPAMEIYSRYRRVEDAEGRDIPLGGDPSAPEPYNRGFLAYVWETVGRLALEEVLGTAEARARNGAAGALEEDARLTALFLWTLQATDAESNGDTEPDAGDEPEEEDDDDSKPKKKKAGYKLIYDVARRFAQPLGIHLDKWEGRIIEQEKGTVRLLPVVERASQLFGEVDAAAISRRIEADVQASRNYSFAFMQDVGAAPEIKPRGRGRKAGKHTATSVPEPPAPHPVTTLDRLHAAMLLQRGGQTNGLRAMLREETQRGPDFLRLANALSRLYPKDSDEKRLLDAMLLAVTR